jgi:lipopolysaccharide biosynthesis regulator YciM
MRLSARSGRWRDYLRQCLDRHPSTPLMIAVAETCCASRVPEAAREFLATRLAQVPSLRGLLRLIRLQQESRLRRRGRAYPVHAGAAAGSPDRGAPRVSLRALRLLCQASAVVLPGLQVLGDVPHHSQRRGE